MTSDGQGGATASIRPIARAFLALAGVNGVAAVALGAVAAHGLRDALSAERLGWIETAARYELAHALALLGAAWLVERRGGLAARLAGIAFALGTLGFCGGLHLAALAGWTWLMPVVPLGGAAFIAGWLAVLAAALRA